MLELLPLISAPYIAVKDYRTGRIPNHATYPLIAVGAITGAQVGPLALALMISFFLWRYDIWNMGDIKYVIALSLLIPEQFILFLIGLWLVSGVGIIYYKIENKINLQQVRIRNGPWICVGVYFSYLF